MDELPDPGRAYALLIGVAEYDDLAYAPLSSCYGSVEKLAWMLTDQDGDMWRLSASPAGQRIKVLGPRVTADAARLALDEATQQKNLDSLLVCISCHGRRYDDWHRTSGLHLAMTSSRQGNEGTHWGFQEISHVLARASRRIDHILLIVDACYADGLSVPRGQGGGDLPDHLRVPGVLVLSATKNRVEAWPRWPGTSERTAFLGALIESITHGIRGSQKILTARSIFADAASRIAAAREIDPNIPVPAIWGDGLWEFPLCRNNDYVQPHEPVGGAPGESAPVFTSSVDCFAAVQEAHDQNRGDTIVAIIRSFSGNEKSAVGEVARFVKELAASEFSDYRDEVYGAVCTKRSPAEIAEFIDCLHRCDAEADAGSIVTGLGKRENAGCAAAEVYRDLLDLGCPECGENAEKIGVLIVADDRLSADALAVWR
jgi:hypothetical protein